MNRELRRFIRQARSRVQNIPLSIEEEIDQHQAKAVEDFQMYLVKRIDMEVRFELMFGADYFWNGAGPAARFEVDDHRFLLIQEGEDCQFFLDVGKEKIKLASLLGNDEAFEDKLLIAIGDALEKRDS